MAKISDSHLLSIIDDLKREPYGIPIHKAVCAFIGPSRWLRIPAAWRYSLGAMYAQLWRLEERGALRSQWSEETYPERGNRRRRYYYLVLLCLLWASPGRADPPNSPADALAIPACRLPWAVARTVIPERFKLAAVPDAQRFLAGLNAMPPVSVIVADEVYLAHQDQGALMVFVENGCLTGEGIILWADAQRLMGGDPEPKDEL